MRSNLSKKVLKVLGLFTSLEGFNVVCSVVKMKLVSIWLKSTGVALFGIFQTTIDTVGILTEMGLRDSAVRDVALARGVKWRLQRIATVVRRWSSLSGLLGALVILALSPWLASSLLGDTALWWQFAILASCMLFRSLLNGEQAILQGSGRLTAIAKGSFWGSLVGLAVSIPMFRWMGEISVVLSIIAYAVAMFVAVIIARGRKKSIVRVSWKTTIKEGAAFMRLGAFMAVAAFIENLSRLVFLGWLQNSTGLDTVGYYQAGYTIVIRYVGMIFAAIMMEFYPRLSANSASAWRTRVYVSHEISIVLSVLTPVVILMLLFRGLVVRLLYTEEFLAAVPFISWAICGVIPRVASTCMSISMLARGDGKAYLITESLDAVIGLGLNIWLFRLLGLQGLGIAYLLWYLIYCLLTGYVYFGRYRLSFSKTTWLTIWASVLCVAATFALIEFAGIG